MSPGLSWLIFAWFYSLIWGLILFLDLFIVEPLLSGIVRLVNKHRRHS